MEEPAMIVTQRDNNLEEEKSFQSIKLKSSDVLDCPTCCKPLKRPIYQCDNGHIACSSCCTKLNKTCPFCRCYIGYIRCLVMEKVIEETIVPCPNAKYGCKRTNSYGNQSSHEELCDYVGCFCPKPNCNYVGSYTNLQSHVRDTHSTDEVIPFLFGTTLTFNMNLGERKVVIFQEKEEGDLIVV